MSEEKERHSVYNDVQLFVLRFRIFSRILWLILYMWTTFMGYVIAFGIPTTGNVLKDIFMRLGGILVLFIGGYSFCDLLFFKDIRLFQDKIVKEWYLFGSRKILLKEAMLKVIRGRGATWRNICNINTNFFLRRVAGITYLQEMATRDDAKIMNKFMAEVTGREVEEFEDGSIVNMNPLLKQQGITMPEAYSPIIENEKIYKGLQQLKTIWAAMFGALILYLFVALYCRNIVNIPMGNNVVKILRTVLYIVAFVILIATRFVRRLVLSHKSNGDAINTAPPSNQSAQTILPRYTSAMVTSLGMSLFIGVCGLILFLLGKNQMDLYLLILVSAAAMITYRPKEYDVISLAQKSR